MRTEVAFTLPQGYADAACDAETNPPEVIEAGQVICEVGISPVKPAEFVIFRLSQFVDGGDGGGDEGGE